MIPRSSSSCPARWPFTSPSAAIRTAPECSLGRHSNTKPGISRRSDGRRFDRVHRAPRGRPRTSPSRHRPAQRRRSRPTPRGMVGPTARRSRRTRGARPNDFGRALAHPDLHAPWIDWVDQVRRLAVTHIVTWDDTDREALEGSQTVREVMRSGVIAVFAIQARPDAPVGSLVDIPGISSEHVDDATVRIEYSLPSRTDVVVALGWSPKWRATVDGRHASVHRTSDNRLSVSLPAGTHHLVLHFASDGADALGRAITVLTILALFTRRQILRARRRRDGVTTPIPLPAESRLPTPSR